MPGVFLFYTLYGRGRCLILFIFRVPLFLHGAVSETNCILFASPKSCRCFFLQCSKGGPFELK